MDADVEPEPCRDCMTPIPPGCGWCAGCERKRKVRETVRVAVADVLHDHGPTNDGPNTADPADCPRGFVHLSVAERVTETEVVGALADVVEAADEFWVGANEVMTQSHHDDIGDSYEALRTALVRLNALT